MNKLMGVLSLFFIGSFVFGGDPLKLSELCAQTLIIKNDLTDHQKATLNDKPLPPENFMFKNIPIRGRNWAGLDLSRFHFTNCTFKDMSFENLDLSETKFIDCKFDRSVRLGGAFLCKSLWFNAKKSGIDLLKQYAGYIKQEKACRIKNDVKKADEWKSKSEGLNKILGCLKLDLTNAKLKNLDLTNINLSNADLSGTILENIDLTGAYLGKVRLNNTTLADVIFTNTLTVFTSNPDLFYRWQQTEGKDKEILQKLFNAGLNIISWSIPNEQLRKIVWQDVDVRGADLRYVNLQGIDLSGVDLENTNLSYANLSNANLTNAKFKNTNLFNANFSGVHLSETFQLPSFSSNNYSDLFELWYNSEGKNKKLLQNLMNSQVNMLEGIPNDILKTVVWQRVDLRNSYWYKVDITGLNLSKTNLQNACFEIENITDVNFSGANLKKSKINCEILYHINFEDANLKSSSFSSYSYIYTLNNVNFNNSNLVRISLIRYQRYEIQNVNLEGVKILDDLKLNNYTSLDLLRLYSDAIKENELEKAKRINNILFLTGINFAKTNLNSLNLKSIDLRYANFRGAHLENVNLEDANLESADFRGLTSKDLKLKGASLSRIKLSDNTEGYCRAAYNIRIYKDNKDAKALVVLKQLLLAQGIDPDARENIKMKKRKREQD